jgi:hypothetical protein
MVSGEVAESPYSPISISLGIRPRHSSLWGFAHETSIKANLAADQLGRVSIGVSLFARAISFTSAVHLAKAFVSATIFSASSLFWCRALA